MSKLLVDTNIVLDLLAKREPFYDSAAKLFSLADKKKIALSNSSGNKLPSIQLKLNLFLPVASQLLHPKEMCLNAALATPPAVTRHN